MNIELSVSFYFQICKREGEGEREKKTRDICRNSHLFDLASNVLSHSPSSRASAAVTTSNFLPSLFPKRERAGECAVSPTKRGDRSENRSTVPLRFNVLYLCLGYSRAHWS